MIEREQRIPNHLFQFPLTSIATFPTEHRAVLGKWKLPLDDSWVERVRVRKNLRARIDMMFERAKELIYRLRPMIRPESVLFSCLPSKWSFRRHAANIKSQDQSRVRTYDEWHTDGFVFRVDKGFEFIELEI